VYLGFRKVVVVDRVTVVKFVVTRWYWLFWIHDKDGRSEDHEYENIRIWRFVFLSEMNSGVQVSHVESSTRLCVIDNHVTAV